MSISTISTYAIYQTTINDVSKTESNIADLQNQLSSGDKSQNFQGIADQSQQYLDLGTKLSKSNQYITNNTLISTRLDATNAALTGVVNTATTLQNLILTRRNNTQGDNSTFSLQIKQQWQAIVSALNVTAEGRFLFSGTATDTPAVDAKNFPSLQTAGVPDDSYYMGSKQDITIRADDNTQMTYNVRADNPGFQKIFAGLAMAKQGDALSSDTDLAQAYDLVQSGLQDIISVQAQVNSNKVSLSTINQSQQTFQQYWKGVQENIGNTDLVAVSTQVAVDQGILQAAFQAFAKINSLRLSDYLK